MHILIPPITVVVQGQVYKWTKDFIDKYKDIPYVTEVIFSTWEGEDTTGIECEVIKNRTPTNHGIGNRNLQIVSSMSGIEKAENEFVLKVRSDMYLPHLTEMVAFAMLHHKESEVFTLSLYPNFPFHPRDHVFFGTKESLGDVFTIPLDEEPTKVYNEREDVRSETYIGMWYYALQNERIYKYIEEPKKYLTDISPCRGEAILEYFEMIKNKIGFIPFPRHHIEWPKHYPDGYPFETTKRIYNECFYEDLY